MVHTSVAEKPSPHVFRAFNSNGYSTMLRERSTISITHKTLFYIRPFPFPPIVAESRLDRVHQYILDCAVKLCRIPDDMVVALVLPKSTSPAKESVCPKGGVFLQGRQQVRHGEWSSLVAMGKRRVGDPTYTCFRRTGRRPVLTRRAKKSENQVHMVWHDRAGNQIILFPIAVSDRFINKSCNFMLSEPKRAARGAVE